MMLSEPLEHVKDNAIFSDKFFKNTVPEPSEMTIAIIDADLIGRKKHRFP